MVVSTAFAELAEVLRRFEHRDLELHEISVSEESLQETEDLTATVIVGVPVFDGVAPQDSITVEAADGTVADDGFTVELSVSVSTAAEPNRASRTSHDSSVEGPHLAAKLVQTANGGVPAYKDPEALQAVYEQYNSFPQMRDALGVDVTSETVRRYMVQYDIHDPDGGEKLTDDQPRKRDSTARATEGATDVGASEEDTNAKSNREEADVVAAREESDHAAPAVRPVEPERTDGATGTNHAERRGTAHSSSEPQTNELTDRSVAELLADHEPDETDDRQLADGIGIPSDLMVSELFDTLESSRTVYEVAQRVGVQPDYVRRLLSELDLLKYVTGRLGETPRELPASERARLLGDDQRPSVDE